MKYLLLCLIIVIISTFFKHFLFIIAKHTYIFSIVERISIRQEKGYKLTHSEKPSNIEKKRTAKILLGISTIFQYRIFCNISQLNQKNDDICTYKDADYNIVFPVYHINNALASCVEICPWKQNVFIIYFIQTKFFYLLCKEWNWVLIKYMYASLCDNFGKWISWSMGLCPLALMQRLHFLDALCIKHIFTIVWYGKIKWLIIFIGV